MNIKVLIQLLVEQQDQKNDRDAANPAAGRLFCEFPYCCWWRHSIPADSLFPRPHRHLRTGSHPSGDLKSFDSPGRGTSQDREYRNPYLLSG